MQGREAEFEQLDRQLARSEARLELRGAPGSGRTSLALAWAAARRSGLGGGIVWLDGRGDLHSQVLALLRWLQRRCPDLSLPTDLPAEQLAMALWQLWPSSNGPDDPVLLVLDDFADDDEGRQLEQRLCRALPPRVRRLVIRGPGGGGLQLAAPPQLQADPPHLRLAQILAGFSSAERQLALRLTALAAAPIPAELLQRLGDVQSVEALQRAGLLQPDAEDCRRLAPALAEALHRLQSEDAAEAAAADANRALVARSLAALLQERCGAISGRPEALELAPLLPHAAHALLHHGSLLNQHERLQLALHLGRLLEACRCGLTGDAGQLVLLQRCLDLCRSGLGSDNSDTATALINLGSAVAAQQPERARDPLERGLEIRQRQLGNDHPLTGRALLALGRALVAAGDPARGGALLEQALAVLQQHPEENEQTCLQLLDELAALQRGQGSTARAEALLRLALTGREQLLGEQHPTTAAAADRLADLLEQQGQLQRAEPLRRQALAARQASLGPGHPDSLAALRRLADLALHSGDPAQAEPLYSEAERTTAESLGSEHPEMGRCLDGMAGLLWSQGRMEEALGTYRRALELLEAGLGSDHPDTAAVVNHLGFVCDALGHSEEARQLLERAVASRERSMGPESLETASSLNNLAAHHAGLGEPALALPLYQRALAIIEAQLGGDHPGSTTVRANLEDCITALRRDNLGNGG